MYRDWVRNVRNCIAFSNGAMVIQTTAITFLLSKFAIFTEGSLHAYAAAHATASICTSIMYMDGIDNLTWVYWHASHANIRMRNIMLTVTSNYSCWLFRHRWDPIEGSCSQPMAQGVLWATRIMNGCVRISGPIAGWSLHLNCDIFISLSFSLLLCSTLIFPAAYFIRFARFSTYRDASRFQSRWTGQTLKTTYVHDIEELRSEDCDVVWIVQRHRHLIRFIHRLQSNSFCRTTIKALAQDICIFNNDILPEPWHRTTIIIKPTNQQMERVMYPHQDQRTGIEMHMNESTRPLYSKL